MSVAAMTPRGVMMRRLINLGQRAALPFVVVAMGFLATVPMRAAGPPPQVRASIDVDGRACTVTATYAWKNVGNVDYADVGIEDGFFGDVGDNSVTFAGSTGEVSVTIPGEDGQRYFAFGESYGSLNLQDETHWVTLRCH